MKKLLIFLDQAMVSGSAFFVTVLISNLFGSEAVGEYSLFLMAIQLPLMFQMALVINPMMSSLVNEKVFTYINQVFVLLIAFTLLLLVSILEYFKYGFVSWQNIIYFFAPIYILKFEFDRRKLFFESKFMKAFFLDVFRCSILIISLFIIQETNMYDTYGYICFIFILMLSCFLSVLLNGGGFRSLLIFDRSIYLPIKDIITSLRHSFWLITAGTIQWGLASFPYLMVNFLFGTEKLGVIREIQNLTGTLNILYQSLENYFPKAIANELKQHGEKSALRYVIKLSVLAGIGIFVLCLFLAFISNSLFLLIYHVDYHEYESIIFLMLFFSFLSFFTFPLTYYFRALNIVKYLLFANIIAFSALFLSFVVSFIEFQLVDIIIAMIISKVVNVIALIYYIVKYKRSLLVHA